MIQCNVNLKEKLLLHPEAPALPWSLTAKLMLMFFRGKGDFFRVNRQATLQSNWGFTCACQVCAASSQQEATNDALKRNLIAYLAKQKKYWDESFWGNLDRIFTLEVAMLDLMRKLEPEMIREMPECLLHCYWYVD